MLKKLALAFALFSTPLSAADLKVAIRTDFPGGNAIVVKNEGDTIQLTPDLRGGPAWFYWNFEAEASQPGKATFEFTAKAPMIGSRGPAVSRDGGMTWHWLGADQVSYAGPADKDKTKPRFDRFAFTFPEAKQKVRFAVAIPYLQRDLDAFLTQHKDNPYLTRSVLTHTRIDRRPVPLVQVGKPGPNVRAFLMTARHHACESMASYVLEGILREAMADSPAGIDFRKKYVLYAVPIVDTDGVELGDQGKHRLPHDHNRDYGKEPLYPEIKAIQDLADLKKVQFSLDLHCPFLRGDIHDAFYFVGLGFPHAKDNLKEWSAWLKEEKPGIAMVPLDLTKDPAKPNAIDRRINSHYFGTRESALFAMCLEVPYTQPNCPLDPPLARAYGSAMVRSIVRTEFVPPNGKAERQGDHAGLLAFRTQFAKIFRSLPKDAEALAAPHLDEKTSPAAYQVEAKNLMANLRLYQKRYPEAVAFAEAAGKDPRATAQQKAVAASSLVHIACNNPKSSASEVEARLMEWLALPYTANEPNAKIYEMVGEFFLKKDDREQAFTFAQKQLPVAAGYEKGKVLNRMAMLQDLLKRPDDAIASRKEAVKILRPSLSPTPAKSIFAAQMTIDLFEALVGIPTATLEEKQAAAAMVLEHGVVSAATKDKVRQKLAEIEKK